MSRFSQYMRGNCADLEYFRPRQELVSHLENKLDFNPPRSRRIRRFVTDEAELEILKEKNPQRYTEEVLKEFHSNGVTCELEHMDVLMTNAKSKGHRQRQVFAENAHIHESIKRTRRELEASRKPLSKKKPCAFCINNKETEAVCRSHELKDEKGYIICPILQKFVCPSCGATGKNAHTIKYCPVGDKIYEPGPSVLTTPRNSTHVRTGQ